ncbi:hypothetical protein A8U91_00397 [Halomonas elongata]|uniref:Uncharacterized protein n=1 Tax=Halomonas elongata TaxID=2746 RepID=A0A1B8P1C4_HALEL|nr:hypothetical protein A8U91_00397 [Halomonas elongata]
MAGSIGDQFDGAQVVAQPDAGMCTDMAFQGLDHRPAGGIVGVNDAAGAMTTFLGQVIRIAGIRVGIGVKGTPSESSHSMAAGP